MKDIENGVDVHQYTADIIGVSRQQAKGHTFKPLYGGMSGTEDEKRYYAAFKEKYKGIRPAPGYPACPEHTVKKNIFKLLETNEIGMKLTESMAMIPASSVSGFYFSHPESSYFSVDKIDEDQINDMAERRNISVDQLKKWLASNLR